MRAELFNLEQLARHAHALAAIHLHQDVITQGTNRLLARLEENEAFLRAYNRETHEIDRKRRVTHAAEWLLDNFYMIEEQILLARRHLPRGYSRELPRLLRGPAAGLPRVYALVLELISHMDAQVDEEALQTFVTAYQTVAQLKLGELWALPIMLRLALIENLRRVTARLTVARRDRTLAHHWVGQLEQVAGEQPSRLVIVVAKMAGANLPMTSSFVAEFCQRLSLQAPAGHLARTWLEQHLAEQGLAVDQMISLESQTQAADQVTISHSIASLRLLGGIDWREFVERTSPVDGALRRDPARVYERMDFATRDRYRHAVEMLAKHSRLTELEVAEHAVQLAVAAARQNPGEERTAHVGYYLVDRGRPRLEQAIPHLHWPWRIWLERAIQGWPTPFYLGGILLVTSLLTFSLTQEMRLLAVRGGSLAFCAVLFFLCSSQLAVGLVNWLAMLVVKPQRLPRLDCTKGIPASCQTMVVVPTMLDSAEAVEHLLEALEIHYLANRDASLHFALLTDYVDAPEEHLPADGALLHQVRAGVEWLAKKYATDRKNIFYLFHRPRRWNAVENRWMGYERKRGKLMEFNAVLRGGSRDRFAEIAGDQSVLPAIKFVITLDTDTQLPRDTARLLVGTMAHPLNRPQLDPVRKIVTEGYSILQPRVGVSLPSAGRSWFVRLFAGNVGIDPYTREVSDVYQDVFKEGSFIGKGIYDVDAFAQALAGRLPENAVLSHDLIESVHARSALVSDVELYEEHPSRYNADINRRHRWIRGDWQIAQWLLPRVPGPDARRIANPLSTLSQWKILDNLRRSLVPAALLLLLLASWLWLPQIGGLGLLLVLAIILAPPLLGLGVQLLRRPDELPLALHLGAVGRSSGMQLGQVLLTLAFLPYDAFISLDAIGRTLLRVGFTHKRLLEWQTAHSAERTARTDLAGFYGTMWIAPAIALLTAAFLVLNRPGELWLAGPVLGLWLTAPWIAWGISQPIKPEQPELSDAQLAFLRRTARQTWRYFETFVSAQENWLPPDNFQEEPKPLIATRTSPTNLGLALLANLAANDFGFLPADRFVARTQAGLAAMQRLERHRGHFYNWYDTRTMKPLPPLYVSTVDSGNLAGHLLTLGAGLTELTAARILGLRSFCGLRDTAECLRQLTDRDAAVEMFIAAADRLAPDGLRAGFSLLENLTAQAGQLAGRLAGQGSAEITYWSRTLEQNCHAQRDELLFIAPWLALPPAVGEAAQPDALREILAALDTAPTLQAVAELDQSLCPVLDDLLAGSLAPTDRPALEQWARCARLASERASERCGALANLAREAAELANMDFSFLFDEGRDLFAIGYNVTDRRRDSAHYDLLASEARLASYVAIAEGQVAQEHWFSLGRLLVGTHGQTTLVSWSGSMFEYLMPLLVMPNYDGTLLDQTYRQAVHQQIEYGQLRGVPWGVSESGYNLTDIHLNYQYRAFGVPGLGLKRGLAEDLVIAPYASLMALMVAPQAACENLARLADDGRTGAYGFYEAVDYTPARLPPGQTSVTIKSFMAHHQGMGLLALAYLLLDRPMQRRFMACPLFRATDLLLQERIPNIAGQVLTEDVELSRSHKTAAQREGEEVMRILPGSGLPAPEVHLLSNGQYHVVISNAGGGYSRWRNLAVTRWREDATRDDWGTFIYLRDAATGETWSAGYQPVQQATKGYEAIFTQARAEFRQQHADIELHMEISVSPEDDVELRRLKLTNHSAGPRTIELTSYAEVILATAAADAAHPAFSNLFVQTEFWAEHPALLCTRRARSAQETPPWLFHMMIGSGGRLGELSYETDRARFIGRGRSAANPAALQEVAALSNTVGAVLDPIVALRRTITLEPDETVRIDYVMGMADNREHALQLIEKYQNPRLADRAFDLAWTHSQVTLRHLHATEGQAQLYARLAGALIYANPARRVAPSVLLNNRRGQSGLWSYGISGDAPIVLLRISDSARLALVQQLVQAHSYWRMKGLTVELMIINEDASGYRQPLHDQIIGLIAAGVGGQLLDKPGGIFVRRLEQVSNEDRMLIQSAARVVLVDENGTLGEQLDRPAAADPLIPSLLPARYVPADAVVPLPPRELIFHNGLGGFTPDGREYVITLERGRTTPAPWVNVLANPHFGTVVSESGGAYTWAENAHEFRLTPWNNDPVTDASGEAFYIRDEFSGQFWSPTPLPARGATPYVIRHGFGYTVYEHTENGIVSELWVYVAIDAPVKFAALKLRNISGRPRRLSATGYWEWVLGDLRARHLLHVQTEVDPKSGALLARNHYNTDFAGRIAFLDVNDSGRTITGDRREFIGRNGSLARPAALKRARLSGKCGAALDPCGVVQVAFDLPAGHEREVTFRLGLGRGLADVQTLIQRYRRPDAGRAALETVWAYWKSTLGAVQVETPDPAVNVMANGWLLYQTLACRLWGRTGFYQSGGAYGFRDQLQDVMALVHTEPTLTREHLLRAAAHQFREGDVQHWWHPPQGRGVRTHFSDDFLWLPYATCRYVATVADTGVLDEKINFLEGRAVKADEEAYYDLPNRSEDAGTLYQHCVRAIEHGLRFGEHGLPLMGCGDWNDGMNLVGDEGRGESVWLAFFLYDVLRQFGRLAENRQDGAFAARCREEAEKLRQNIEQHAWDGGWYRRAYFDDGTPLGSHENAECQIDSLPQSWSVISGAGEPARSREAMQAVLLRLVRSRDSLIQLFDPPFDKSDLNPGYIKGYIPGVRENGGQYTHGAIWTAMGFALLGEDARAWELFRLLNPVNHGATAPQIARYKVEPYVVAADVYGVAPHIGRGGWTWYTGSAGWMYRLLVETLLGLNLEGTQLRLAPRFPGNWTSFRIHYRYRRTQYHITLTKRPGETTEPGPGPSAEVAGNVITLVDDGQEHAIELTV